MYFSQDWERNVPRQIPGPRRMRDIWSRPKPNCGLDSSLQSPDEVKKAIPANPGESRN